MSQFSDSSLPPPRWRGARTRGGCGRTLLMVGVGAIGIIGAFCCIWTGLVHATVEDLQLGRDLPPPSSTVPEPLRIAPSARDVLRPDVEGMGGTSGPLSIVPEDDPRPGSSIEVRQGLKPMPAPSADERPAPRAQPREQPRKRSGPSEEELFGF